jgi:hypothetical protein
MVTDKCWVGAVSFYTQPDGLAVAAVSVDWPVNWGATNELDIGHYINMRVNSQCYINMLTGTCSSVLLI